MLVEEGVLGGERGVDQVLGDLAQRDDGPFAAVGIVELPQQRALTVKNLRGLEAGVVADRAKRRQVAREHGVAGRGALKQDENAQKANPDHRHHQARADHQWRAQFRTGTTPVAVFLRRLEAVEALQSSLGALLGTPTNLLGVSVAVAVTVTVALHQPRRLVAMMMP